MSGPPQLGQVMWRRGLRAALGESLSRPLIVRMLNIPESKIPTVLILRGTRNLQSQYDAARGFFSNVLDIGTPNGIIEYVLIGDLAGRPVGFACVYGAPMASEIVHIF